VHAGTTIRKQFCTILFSHLLLFTMPVAADNGVMLDLLRILRDRGSLTESEYRLLVQASKEDGEKAGAKPGGNSPAAAAEPRRLPEISTAGKLQLATEKHRFRIGGRIMHDATLVDNDGDGDVGSSEHQFRRARIYLSGTAWKYWDWKFQYDLEDADDSGQAIEDAYVRYTGLKPLSVTVGQRKAPYSLDALTSSKYITFIERSVPTDLFASESFGVGGRSPGITLSTQGDRWTAEGGFYTMRQQGGATDEGDFVTSDGATVKVALGTDSIGERKIDDGLGFTGRLTYLPLADSGAGRYVHLGAAFGYKHYANRSITRFRVRPAVSEGDRIIDSDGLIAADNYWSVGLEAAAILGPFSAQAEYYHGDIDTVGADLDSSLEGWYVQGSYFLTGDRRRYRGSAFSSVKVSRPLGDGGPGAWELGLRFSGTELDSTIGGDQGHVLTAALNWYVNNNIMFRANYVKTFCDSSGSTCDWGSGDGEPAYFILRSQVFF